MAISLMANDLMVWLARSTNYDPHVIADIYKFFATHNAVDKQEKWPNILRLWESYRG